ncbi:MAG: 5-formyltetrahydrofolate cyclo-ligase [Bacteroidetes bacterium]|nr:5-formyltetrahydrofolate cyclo-ligase [Bacteroidota bacterium]
MIQKAVWRAHCRAYRAALQEAEYVERSARIRDHLLALPEWSRAGVVALYRPLRARREVDVGPLFSAAWAAGKRVLAPVMANQTLRFGTVYPDTRWRLGPYGVEEPESWDLGAFAPDLIVVPSLGADRLGYRIGYGKGYYDRALRGQGAFLVAPVYEACVAERLCSEPYDVPVHALVTEEGVWRP